MKFLTNKIIVRRYRTNTFDSIQQLEQDWYILGKRVWRTVLDTESVPAWAEIQVSTLGSTEWRSRFASYIS